MKNTMEVNGIQCDAEGCDYIDETVKLDDYENWLNKPCPKCGANLLTQEDLDIVNIIKATIEMFNAAGLVPETEADMKSFKVNMNGSGKVELQEITKE